MSAVLADIAQAPAATWDSRPLVEVADILDSQRVPVNAKGRESRHGSVPYYGATGQVGWIDEHIFDEGLVLLGEDGAPFLESNKAKAYVIRGKSWVNNHAHVLRARAVPTGWLAHYLNSISYAGLVTGTTRLKLTQAAMRQIRVPVAPWHVMENVVAEIEKQFSRLDEAVANLKRVKANLRRYKAAVLKAAVEGCLVPTEAQLARREGRDFETGEQLLRRTLQQRRVRWTGRRKYKELAWVEAMPLATLPDGWVWATVDQLTSLVTSGSRGWGEFYSAEGVLFIRAQDIKTDALRLNDVARVDVPADAEGTRSSVDGGNILVTITGANVTKAALVPELAERAFVSQHVALLKFVVREVSPFAYLCVVSPANGRKTLETWAYGAGKPGLSLEQVRALPIALPPLAEQDRIVAEVDRRLSIVREVEAEADTNLNRAQALQQSIMSQAFSCG